MKKSLASAKAFLPFDDTFEYIVKLCRLRPNPSDWTVWFDDDGNKLKICKNKSLQIYPRKIKRTIISTDLFYQSRPGHIVQHSEWFAAIKGVDDSQNKVGYVWFIGHDKRMRAAYFVSTSDNNQLEWVHNYPPLLSGIKPIRNLINLYKTGKDSGAGQYRYIRNMQIKPKALLFDKDVNWHEIETWLKTS